MQPLNFRDRQTVCQFAGEIFFRRFAFTFAPHSSRKCQTLSTRNYSYTVIMAATNTQASELITELDSLVSKATSADALMRAIVALLHEKLTRYNWVGFYMIEKEIDRNMLVLGPFKGTMTPHTRIPLNQGICGAAASSGRTVIVDDVNKDSRYLACSLETKSEIVVPVFAKGKVVGELDIDSHFLAAFGPEDRKLCEHAAVVLGKYLEAHS
jgi:L-methionine (R)-S-oxide reductase